MKLQAYLIFTALLMSDVVLSDENYNIKITNDFEEITTVKTDISLYADIYKKNKSNKNFLHFPTRVKPNSKISARQRFLQGGGWLYLREKVSINEITELSNKFKDSSKIYTLKDRQELLMKRAKGKTYQRMPVNKFTIKQPYSELWVVYITGHSDPMNWNHGYIYGVAINENQQTIDYFTEEW